MVRYPLLPKVAGMDENPCGVWKPRLYSRKRIRRGGFTKFKTVSTRFKDIADLYYLSDKVNTAKLRECVDTYILSDTELPQYNNVDDILKVLNVIASNKKYKKRVISSKQLWIDDDIDEMFSVIIHTLEKI